MKKIAEMPIPDIIVLIGLLFPPLAEFAALIAAVLKLIIFVLIQISDGRGVWIDMLWSITVIGIGQQ